MAQKKPSQWHEYLLARFFIALPHHFISRIVYHVTRWRGPFVPWLIRWFVKAFRVDLAEAKVQDLREFKTFNDFFVRELQAGSRPIAEGVNTLACPVDGTVSQIGDIRHDHLFQAKNQCYAVEDLLGGDRLLARLFSGGRFATIYLAPYNYHRIHMPVDGRLKQMIHVPGRLFSVAPWTVRRISRLFARNERVVCLFSTPAGPMAMILVGAINVAAIETVWHGLVTPPKGKKISEYNYDHAEKDLVKGNEMGRFNMGSTVILLTSAQVQWQNLKPGQPLKLGQAIATFR